MSLNVADILHDCKLFHEVQPPSFARLVTMARICRFRKALEEDHGLCRGMLTGMTLWVRHLVNLMEDLVLRDAAGRVARFLLESARNGDGTVALPSLKRHVASHLNLTSETFSRTLRRLVEAGLIAQPDAARVRLLDPERLRQVAAGLFPQM